MSVPPAPATPAPAQVAPAQVGPAQVGPVCPTPILQVAICNKPGGGRATYYDRTVRCNAVAGHLGHGCLLGTCAANGR